MTYNPEAIRKTYDMIAKREDEFEKEHSLRNEIPREFIKRHLGVADVVLDAGGGTGINAIMMAQRCQRVTLVDISPGILELAAVNIQNAEMTEGIDLIEGDITDLGQFGDATFSFVVCLGGSLSYVLEENSQAIQELVRATRKGSVLIIGCDSKYGFVRLHLSGGQLDEAVRMYETSEYEAGEGAYARLYTVAELTGLLEQAGCEVLEVVSTPTLMVSWGPNMYGEDEEKWKKLRELELKVCAVPELLGMGRHLFCVARKA
jgi:ubiquinone/menaquinone biosynthesis C-methylase UbiE